MTSVPLMPLGGRVRGRARSAVLAVLIALAGLFVPLSAVPQAAAAVHGGGETVPPTGGSLGPNVYVFDPTMPQTSIQNTLNTIANQQTDEFGTRRYAVLFKPGTYGSTANPLNFSVG